MCFFREDILNILRSVEAAGGGIEVSPEDSVEEMKARIDGYKAGVARTLVAVGLAFGLSTVTGVDRAAPGQDRTVLYSRETK